MLKDMGDSPTRLINVMSKSIRRASGEGADKCYECIYQEFKYPTFKTVGDRVLECIICN